MSIILFSLLISPLCFINNIYPVNGIITNAEYMNITNNFLERLDTSINKLTKELNELLYHTNEHKQIIKKYAEQRNNLLDRLAININEIKEELDNEKN